MGELLRTASRTVPSAGGPASALGRPGRGSSVGRRGWAGRRGDESGQALTVELVLLFPLLLAMLFGLLEFGWWLNAHMVVSNAADQAARSVAIQGLADDQTVNSQIAAVMKGGDLAVGSASYSGAVGGQGFTGPVTGPAPYACATPPPGMTGYAPESATVTITYHYHPLFPFLDTPLFLDIGKALPHTITSTATVPVEQEWLACPTP
jgi:hypothetical protein